MIGIQLNKKDFEYDLHSLTKAFYPKEDVHIFYEWDAKEEVYELLIQVFYEEEAVKVQMIKQGQCIFTDAMPYHAADRKDSKNKVKQLLYQILKRETGKSLPWGNLTGIRPTKIPMALLEKGMSHAEIADYMRSTYDISDKKTALCIAVANQERELLKDIDYENGYSLYVGIPFCPSICLYCSFSSYPLQKWQDRVDAYLDALLKELTFLSEAMKGRTLDTVYIGGGTPTTLEAEQMHRLLHHIESTFPLSNVKEYTLEAGRPDSITEEKLRVLKSHPVTRISVNPQTMNQQTLEIIGRQHAVEDTIHAFDMARKVGFDNINMDIIAGLPGETKEDVAHTLKEIKRLHPDSLTVHSLAIKRAARLHMFQEDYQEMTCENSQEIMDMAMSCAYDMGMRPYYLYRQKNIAGNLENIGYAAKGKAGIYNILIMEEKQPILAAGAGASTKLVFDSGRRIERVENVKDVTNYITRIDEMIERKKAGIATYL